MEIRLLHESEVQMAVQTAHEVFERCVRPYVRTEQEVTQFYGYVQTENLIEEMRVGRLVLWGAFDGAFMCAVSAMQTVGHITMLYVKPQYTGKRIGTQMLNRMCVYAKEVLYKGRVTINVMPIASASFFYKRGFTLIQNVPMSQLYVSLERQTASVREEKPIRTYGKKQVKPRYVVTLVVGVLFFCMATLTAVTIRHIVVDGLCTEADYEFQSYEAEEI